jgi:hypothetical protein
MGKPSFKATTHEKTLGLNSRLQVCDLSTPRQCTTIFNLLRFIQQQISTTSKMKKITHYMNKLAIDSYGKIDVLLHSFSIYLK